MELVATLDAEVHAIVKNHSRIGQQLGEVEYLGRGEAGEHFAGLEIAPAIADDPANDRLVAIHRIRIIDRCDAPAYPYLDVDPLGLRPQRIVGTAATRGQQASGNQAGEARFKTRMHSLGSHSSPSRERVQRRWFPVVT
jgi:hypothetical protein